MFIGLAPALLVGNTKFHVLGTLILGLYTHPLRLKLGLIILTCLVVLDL